MGYFKILTLFLTATLLLQFLFASVVEGGVSPIKNEVTLAKNKNSITKTQASVGTDKTTRHDIETGSQAVAKNEPRTFVTLGALGTLLIGLYAGVAILSFLLFTGSFAGATGAFLMTGLLGVKMIVLVSMVMVRSYNLVAAANAPKLIS